MLFKSRETNVRTSEKHPAKRVNTSERIYAIGDIHGRFDLLMMLLEQINADMAEVSDNRTTRIIFLGDYIDRGDQSREVLELLSDTAAVRAKLNADPDAQIDFLAGNHEIAMLDFLQDPMRSSNWLDWGGLQTIASFGVLPRANAEAYDLKKVRDEFYAKVAPYVEFLRNLDKLVVSGNVVFVHAGLDSDYMLDAQPNEAIYWGRAVSGKGLGMSGYKVVHGHFASDAPVSRPDRICVDTGAYFTGCLSAVRLDDKEAYLQARM